MRHASKLVRLSLSLSASFFQAPYFGICTWLTIGNCDIDFLNFHHCQVWNFKILNLYEQNPNFGVIFQKYQKQNQKSTKYFKTSRKPSVIPLKFHKMSWVSWNLVHYLKSHNFALNSVKVQKIALILLTFIHALKNNPKLANSCL